MKVHKLLHLVLTITLPFIMFLVLLWLLIPSPSPTYAAGTIRYITTTGSDTGNCTSSTNPCATVQYAVNQAQAGDELRLAGGIYTNPDMAVEGRLLQLNKEITLSGGYNTSNWNTANPTANPTILDGQTLGPVVYVDTAGITITVRGLTLQRGSNYGLYVRNARLILSDSTVISNTSSYGIYLYDSDGSQVLNSRIANNSSYGAYVYSSVQTRFENNTFSGNSSYGLRFENASNYALVSRNVISGSGYGVYLANSNTYLTLSDNTIRGNSGDGVYFSSSNSYATLTNNIISGSPNGNGVEFSSNNDYVTLTNNTITGNTQRGLYFYSTNSNMTLSGNTIADNSDDGIYFASGTAQQLDNNLIVRNGGDGIEWSSGSGNLRHNTLADNRGGAGLRVTYATLALTNTLVAGQSYGFLTTNTSAKLQANYTLWDSNGADTNTSAGGVITTTNNRYGTPGFTHGSDPFEAYHLAADSAAIDAGIDAGLLVDIDGQSRPYDNGFDIGADEYPGHAIPPANLTVTGPMTGLVQLGYSFTATVNLITTTPPITYIWQVASQPPLTHVSNRLDSAAFTWYTPGIQPITVTASNESGAVTVTHFITITAPLAASLPFFDNFETGILGPSWLPVTDAQGRVQVSTYAPYSGTYGVLLDDSVGDSTYSTAALVLAVNLAGQPNAVLDFWWRSFGDENHPQDGVFISDNYGATWFQVLSFNNGPATYRHDFIDLGAAAAANGLAFNDHFNIKFQFYDDRSIPDDGYGLDAVRVANATPIEQVQVTGPATGIAQASYPFTATITPTTATPPVSYIWQATDLPPVTHTGTFSDAVAFTWSSAGSKVVRVTAINAAGSVVNNQVIALNEPPILRVTPTAFEVGLSSGNTATRSLTIYNNGGSDLNFALDLTSGSLTGPLDVAVLGAENTTAWNNDVTTMLQTTGRFNNVSFINVASRTPTLTELLAYRAVLVFSDPSFYNATSLGDVLADYVDAGGGVVVMHFALSNGSYIRGRFLNSSYYAIDPVNSSSQTVNRLGLGVIEVSGHPVLEGVSSFNGGTSSYHSSGALTSGARVIARYSNGQPLVAEKVIQSASRSVRRVDLNFFPPSSSARSDFWDATTHGGRLMANALIYTAQPAYIRVTPERGVVSANNSTVVAVTLNSADLISDTYRADLVVRSNDPVTPQLRVPVTLQIGGQPMVVITPTLLSFGQVFVGVTKTLTLQVENDGAGELLVSNIAASDPTLSASPASFSVPGFSNQPITVTYAPTAAQTLSATLTLTTNDPITSLLTVAVAGAGIERPAVNVEPMTFSITQDTGRVTTRTLMINNNGASPLDFTLSVVNNIATIQPVNGTVPGLSQRPITVTFDSATRSAGAYTGQIRVASNDPVTPLLSIPVSFTVILTAPELPINPNPPDTQVNIPVGQTFSWQASLHASSYNLYLWPESQSKPLTPTISGLAQASYNPPTDLTPGTTYHWQVEAHNAAGNTTGPEWSFTTQAPFVDLTVSPTGPTLVVVPGANASLVAVVGNNGTGLMTGITVTSPPHLPWVSVETTGLIELAAGQSSPITITASATPAQTPGFYRDFVTIHESSGDQARIALTVQVSPPTRTLTVNVANDQSQPVAGANLALEKQTSSVIVTEGVTQTYYASAQGTTNSGGMVTLSNLEVGSYDYTLWANNHQTVTGTLTIAAGSGIQTELLTLIAQANLTLSPQTLSLGVLQGQTANGTITVVNNGAAPLTGFVITSPTSLPWIYLVTPSSAPTLAAGQNFGVTVVASPPVDVPIGLYQDYIMVSAGSQTRQVALSVEVSSQARRDVQISVKDGAGAPVTRGSITLVQQTPTTRTVSGQVTTYNQHFTQPLNGSGAALFNNLEPGAYNYHVTADDYQPADDTVVVNPGAGIQSFEVSLNPDPFIYTWDVQPIQQGYDITLTLTYDVQSARPGLLIPERHWSFRECDPQLGDTFEIFNPTPITLTLDQLTFNVPGVSVVPGAYATEIRPGGSINVPVSASQSGDQVAQGTITATFSYTAVPDNFVTFTFNPSSLTTPWLEPGQPYSRTFLIEPVVFDPAVQYRLVITQPSNLDWIRLMVDQAGPMAWTSDTDIAANLAVNTPTWLAEGTYQDRVGIRVVGDDGAWREGSLNVEVVKTAAGVQIHTTFELGPIPMTKQTTSSSGVIYAKTVGCSSSSGGSGGGWTWFWGSGGGGGGGGWTLIGHSSGSSYAPPTFSNPAPPPTYGFGHQQVRLIINQRVMLQGEGFQASLTMDNTSSSPLEVVSVDIRLTDLNDVDQTTSFTLLPETPTLLGTIGVGGSTAADWLILPDKLNLSSVEGQDFSVRAIINYTWNGVTYSVETAPETITVLPAPNLVINYEMPLPDSTCDVFDLRTRITNQGAGPARNLRFSSAQPYVSDNVSNIPIGFQIVETFINGVSQANSLNLTLGDLPPGQSVEIFWRIRASRPGRFVEFTSDYRQSNYQGLPLTPLVSEISTTFITPPYCTGNTSISGRVTHYNGDGVPGVNIRTDTGMSATTNISGYYTITGIFTGTYTLTATAPGFTFSPTVRTVNVPPDAVAQNFTASRPPIIFVPGIAGTKLANNSGELWVNIARMCDDAILHTGLPSILKSG